MGNVFKETCHLHNKLWSLVTLHSVGSGLFVSSSGKKNSEAIVGPFVEQRSGILPRIVHGAEGEVLSLSLSRGGEVLSLSLQEISS